MAAEDHGIVDEMRGAARALSPGDAGASSRPGVPSKWRLLILGMPVLLLAEQWTILKDTRGQVQGLTTAAGIWAVGAVGVAIGTGMYVIGIVCAAVTGLVLASERVLRLQERLSSPKSSGKDGGKPGS